jgi:hypothetical protein
LLSPLRWLGFSPARPVGIMASSIRLLPALLSEIQATVRARAFKRGEPGVNFFAVMTDLLVSAYRQSSRVDGQGMIISTGIPIQGGE